MGQCFHMRGAVVLHQVFPSSYLSPGEGSSRIPRGSRHDVLEESSTSAVVVRGPQPSLRFSRSVPSSVRASFTDASIRSWGAGMDPQGLGRWIPTQREQHINRREIEAVYLALRHWDPVRQGETWLVVSDNSTVVSSSNKQGGDDHVGITHQTGYRDPTLGPRQGQLSVCQTRSGSAGYPSRRSVTSGSDLCRGIPSP